MRGHAFLDPLGTFAAPPTDGAGRTAAPHAPLSYEALLGGTWHDLPAATRARFACHEAHFAGTMRLGASRAGVWVARICRLVGSPLPPPSTVPVEARVDVEADPATGGSRWTRRYAFSESRIVAISSVKAIDRDGALVERLPMGLRMRLRIDARDGALHFISNGYYLELPSLYWRGAHYAGWRLPFPSWWLPGRTHVIHADLGDGRFRFAMTIRHRWLGTLFDHDGVFRSIGD